MKQKVSFKKIALFLSSFVLVVSNMPAYSYNAFAKTDVSYEDYIETDNTFSVDNSVKSYREYLSDKNTKCVAEDIYITADNLTRYEEDGNELTATVYTDYEGREGKSVYSEDNALMEYDFEVKTDGLYYLKMNYCTVDGKTDSVKRTFFIDGLLPYRELSGVEFSRVWTESTVEKYTDEAGVELLKWESDNQGFELKPQLEEIFGWNESFFYDSNGFITTPLSVYLTKGHHTLTVLSQLEPVIIESIVLTSIEESVTYDEYIASLGEDKLDTTNQSIRIEAENSIRMSSQMLYPRQDQSSPLVYPSSPKLLYNNTIGGTSFQNAGQWIEWEFEANQDGYYNISMFCKQNFVRGVDVSRKIYIDGEVPFSEMNDYGFEYKQGFRDEVLADASGNPYKFYLTKGKHVIRMEVVLGDMSSIIEEVKDAVNDLNSIYRKVIYITGVAPDVYRDYQIESSIPGLGAELVEAKSKIDHAIEQLSLTAGNNSDKLTVLRTMSDQLEELIEDEERFPEVISSYKVNVRACANWITQVLPQPLQVDRILITSPDCHEEIKASALENMWFEMQRLFYSFIIDYNQIGNVTEDSDENVTLTLWIGTGRDQANVIKSLIDDDFTKETGINVNVQLVDMSTLLRASLANEGPDVAIQVANTTGIAGAVLNTGNDTPVNYGLRNAVLDLTQFEDYEAVKDRFYESAMVPFEFEGACYALPDTQTFPMMFYRNDILNEIGLEVPKTWDEVKVSMTALSKNQMEIGMLPSEQIFAMLLYQNGGEYYSENKDASALDSDIAIDTFKDYCEYYTDYKLDKATSVEERFRTGECPIIIADYTTYNNLKVSAPDIDGLWDFTNVPGVMKEDGSIDITTGSSGLADMIMSDTSHPQESWEFLKWWTDCDTQVAYGREMEALMGESARVATANKEALSQISWPSRDYERLKSQLEYVKGIPQVPGGYYTWRNVNNAFYSVTTDVYETGRTNVATPREELMDKVIYINDEIDFKRKEFGLKLASEE